MKQTNNILESLWLVGLSYRQTPLEVREKFSFSKQQIVQLISRAKESGINFILPISTCNRTEIYGRVEHPHDLLNLLGSSGELKQYAYIKNAMEAVSHLFSVTAGMDSQILGDAQITGQVRKFLQTALSHNAVDAILNRLAEDAISAGKRIKTQTRFHNGASSIAQAAVKHVVKQILPGKLNGTKALVAGAGKMGRLTVESLLNFLPEKNITVINRTNEKAKRLADESGVKTTDYDSLCNEVRRADLIFTATSSPQPIITCEFLKGENLSGKIFIDLSLPRNVESSLPAAIISIDHLIDTDNRRKENYIRVAEEIIKESIGNYYKWLHRYELAQHIKSEIHDSIFDNSLEEHGGLPKSKFIDDITRRHLKHFHKEKQSRNLAA